MTRRRYAIVGTGGRAVTYVDGILGPHAGTSELVGLCDVSPTRLAFHNRRAERATGHGVPCFAADEFDEMIRTTAPDVVIVTTVDALHDVYVVRAMELGCDAVTEKPMATDAEKVNRILDAVDRTGRSLRVTFNYRYMPAFTMLRSLIMDGAVGRPTLVHFSWVLDTRHGADYFRRWHREKQWSGGLLVHKASHHFDLVNWWLAARPVTVFAFGDVAFYGAERAAERGETYAYARYTGAPEAADDPFALTLDSHRALQRLYLEAEGDSGYVRDQNVFSPGVTTEDTASVTVRYDNGAMMAYSLVAYSPWEGLRVDVTGTGGRAELFIREGIHVIGAHNDADLATQRLVHHPMFGAPAEVAIPPAAGGHGGGDPALLADILAPDDTRPPDPFGRAATHVDGALSVAVGISANRSIETGQAVDVASLIRV